MKVVLDLPMWETLTMKAYAIFPLNEDFAPESQRAEACIEIVTGLVCDSLRAGGDNFHVTVDWRDSSDEAASICTEGITHSHVVSLDTHLRLHELVRRSVDPNDPECAGVIRSTATCRAATFGFDGQAFLCLKWDDDPPVSPNPEMVVVEDQTHLLTETDYFDGVIVSS